MRLGIKPFITQILLFTLLNAISLPLSAKKADEQLYLQLGSFNQVANAKHLSALVHDKTSLPVHIAKNDTLNTVTIGPFSDREKALQLKHALNDLSPDAHIKEFHLADSTTTKPLKLSTPPIPQAATSNHKPPINTPNTRLWNLQQADIRSVIHEIAKETGKNFVIDPRVQGKISITSGHPIDAKALYQVFLSILQVSGFAAIPNGDVIKVVPNMDARTLGGGALFAAANGDDMTTDVIKLHFVPAEQLVPVLRPLMPQWSSVSAYGPSNTLIISGRASNIKRLHQIIQQVDDSDANGIDVIPLHYALAMDVASTLKSLLETRTQGRNYQRQATTIAADDKSNTILVSGSKEDRLRIRILISKIDKEDSYGSGNTEIVYLRYLRAQDLVPILSGIAKANFSGTVGMTIGTITQPHLDTSLPSNTDNNTTDSDSSSSQSQQSSSFDASNVAANTKASTNSREGDKKPKVELIAEPNTNAVIISAPRSVMRTLRRVIAKLDARPAQLLVEALITEIDEKVINQLGLEWGTVTTDSQGNSSFNQGFAIINSKTNLGQFQAQLYALVTSQKANILSTPSVVVLDNHQAKILIGKEVSIQDSNYPGNAGGAGTTNPYNTFTRQKVALHLYVRPQISQGESVQLQIDQGNDTLADPTDATSGRPVINTSNINTSVLVNSGDILVLGGLIQNGLQKSGNKIPILGDIPGVGEIFKRNQNTRDKKVLMVFIRPIIISNPKSSIQVTGDKYNRVRGEQLEWFQKERYNPEYNKMVLPRFKDIDLPKPFAPKLAANYHHGK